MTITFDDRPAHLQFLQAAATVFTKTDRLLSGRANLRVTTPDSGIAPAWTDGQTISLRADDFIDDWDTTEAMTRLMGLNYHEMVHVLYTPREGDPGAILVRNAGLHSIFNAAEDQRGETLFSTTYKRAGLYFTQAVLDLILADPADGTWVLLAGRRYLPQRLRDLSKATYRGDADEWQGLIDRYLVVDWQADPQGAVDILQEMADHLDKNTIQHPDGCGTPILTQGRTDDAAEDGPLAKVREQIEDERESQEPADELEDEDIDEDDDWDDDEADDEDTDPAGGGEGLDDPEQDDDADGSDPEPADEPEDEDLADLAEELAEELAAELEKASAATESEIRAEMERSDKPMGEDFTPHADRVPVTDAARALAGDLEAVLSELRAEVDPGWATHQARGRINVGRYMQRQDWQPMDELFDEWQEGAEEAMDIEIALLVDTSSSMAGQAMYRVAEVAWAMKRALQGYGIAMAVLAYDSVPRTIYTDLDEADAEWMPKPLATGGTMIQPTLMEVGRHFNYSPHRRRILVTLTDGGFWDHYRHNGQSMDIVDIVQSIDAEVRVLLGYRFDAQDWGFDRVARINDIDQVADAIRETIVDGVRAALR